MYYQCNSTREPCEFTCATVQELEQHAQEANHDMVRDREGNPFEVHTYTLFCCVDCSVLANLRELEDERDFPDGHDLAHVW